LIHFYKRENLQQMARSKSRSRSVGRGEDGYVSDDTVRPFKRVKKKGKALTKSPKKVTQLHYKEGDILLARWPGSRLYYNATVQLVRPEQGEYDVMYENGVVFTITPKDVYKQGAQKKSTKIKATNGDSLKKNEIKESAELTEDEDITSILVNAASNLSKKLSNSSFKAPSKVVRPSNGSRTSKSANSPDMFSDDEEAATQRNSSKRLSKSSRSSRLDKVSFSSTINSLLDNVFRSNEVPSNGTNGIEENGEDSAEHINGNSFETKESIEEIEKSDEKASISSRVSTRASTTKSSKKADLNTSQGLDEFSEDEMPEPKPSIDQTPEVAPPTISGFNCEWMISLFFMFLCPSILITLHNICTSNVANLPPPRISMSPSDYFDGESVLIVLAFVMVLRLCEFVCIGKYVEGYRMNGFQTLLICLLSVPALLAHDVSLRVVTEKYFYLMTSCIFLSFAQSLLTYSLSFLATEEKLTTKGSTGNFHFVSDIYHGRELNPTWTGCNLKLQTFRFSMIGLALLNVALVTQYLMEQNGEVNFAVIMTSSMQVMYAMDAMFNEEYYFNSVDYLNSGYGWSVISSYLTFPFLPTIITRYILHLNPTVKTAPLVFTGILNLLGYIIYRTSETERCELSRDPSNPALSHLQTLEGLQGRKLIVSGWWGLVRHPNYLGEILIQWSWVLPAASAIGLKFWTPYYLPLVTTLMLVLRCAQTNNRHKRKYGNAWETYSRKVQANIFPMVY